jgi:transketolase
VAILATGILVNDALEVSEELEKRGIQARVLDIHTIKPLDEDGIILTAKETGAIVTVEDANIIGGLGGAVAELLSEKHPVPIRRVGVKDQFGESGTSEEIKECYGLTPPFIKKAVLEVMSAKRS